MIVSPRIRTECTHTRAPSNYAQAYDIIPQNQVTECPHTQLPSNYTTECPFIIAPSDDVTECPHTRAPSDRIALFNVILIKNIMDSDTKSSIEQVPFCK